MPLEKIYIIRIGNFSIRWNIEVIIEISSRNMIDWHNTDYIDPKKVKNLSIDSMQNWCAIFILYGSKIVVRMYYSVSCVKYSLYVQSWIYFLFWAIAI